MIGLEIGENLTKFIKIGLMAFLASAFLTYCSKKEEPPVVEEDLLPEEDLELLEEPELQSPDEAGAMDGQMDAAEEDADSKVKFSTIPKNTPPPSTGQFSENGRYVVQVSIYKSKYGADKLKSKLESEGYPAYVAEVENPTPDLIGTYYRVRIGNFKGLSDAKAFGENSLLPNNYNFWIDLKKNDNVGKSYSDYSSDYSEPAATSEPAYTPEPEPVPEPEPMAQEPQAVPEPEPIPSSQAEMVPEEPTAQDPAPSPDSDWETVGDSAAINDDEW